MLYDIKTNNCQNLGKIRVFSVSWQEKLDFFKPKVRGLTPNPMGVNANFLNVSLFKVQGSRFAVIQSEAKDLLQ